MIETQLAETTQQLQELKLRQKQLEARNHLLEKVAVLNKQQSVEKCHHIPDYQVLRNYISADSVLLKPVMLYPEFSLQYSTG